MHAAAPEPTLIDGRPKGKAAHRRKIAKGKDITIGHADTRRYTT